MKIRPSLLIVGITLIGLALRFYHLDFQPIACDELYSFNMAGKPLIEMFGYVMTNDTNPPLFYVFTHIFYPLVRIPSALFGMLTIPAVYLLGKEYKNESVGLLSAGIIAILYPMIYYSQFARAYAMMTFVMVLFFIQFVRIQNGKSSDYYLLGIVGAVALWTHLYAIFPILATILVISIKDKKNALKSFVPILITLIAFIPLFLSTRETRIEEYGNFPGFSVNELITMIPIEFFNIGLFIIIPIILIGLYFSRSDKLSLELDCIVALSLITGISVSLVTQVFPRYFLPLLPILVLFASIGLISILDKMKPWAKPIIVIGFFVMLALTQYGSLLAQYTVTRLSC